MKTINFNNRTYCDTISNHCVNVKCDFHLGTKNKHYRIRNNTLGLVIDKKDKSKTCEDFNRV